MLYGENMVVMGLRKTIDCNYGKNQIHSYSCLAMWHQFGTDVSQEVPNIPLMYVSIQ